MQIPCAKLSTIRGAGMQHATRYHALSRLHRIRITTTTSSSQVYIQRTNRRLRNLRQSRRVEALSLCGLTGAVSQAGWLSAQLQCGGPCNHLVAFSHIPPFIAAPDEPDGYYNFESSVRRLLLEQLKAAGCTKWFCGHYHSNSGGWDGDLEVVITGAAGPHIPLTVPKDSPLAIGPEGQDFSNVQCSETVSGMRLVKVNEQDVQHTWYTVAQLDQGQHNR